MRRRATTNNVYTLLLQQGHEQNCPQELAVDVASPKGSNAPAKALKATQVNAPLRATKAAPGAASGVTKYTLQLPSKLT